MLENLLNGLRIASVASLPMLLGTCAAETVKEPAKIYRVDDFYSSMDFIEESNGLKKASRKVRYSLKNSIIAEVVYKIDEGSKEIFITILGDPDKVLTRNTPRKNSITGATYRLNLGGTKVHRELNFSQNGESVVVFVHDDGSFYINVGNKPFYLPGLGAEVYKKLGEIDEDLSIREHIDLVKKLEQTVKGIAREKDF